MKNGSYRYQNLNFIFFFVEEEKKRLLKELYDIEWKTTDEMNPNWDFI